MARKRPKKSKILQIRVTPRLHKEIVLEAGRRGKFVSEWIRELLGGEIVRINTDRVINEGMSHGRKANPKGSRKGR